MLELELELELEQEQELVLVLVLVLVQRRTDQVGLMVVKMEDGVEGKNMTVSPSP